MRIAFSSFIRCFENRYERRIGYALTAQNLCRPDQISGTAVTKPTTLDSLSAIAPCKPLAKAANRSSDRRKFEPNTAISGKQSYLRAHILYLSTRDRCEPFRCCALSAPCSLRRSSRNQASSPSVSLGLGISAGGFLPPAFLLSRVWLLATPRR